uniref:non-specific serine/threonine protein kinase n=1 Tax=Hirondellea gigas TaxID=1518452 RepID=A0A6A7GA08_9CRUS
MQTCKVLRTIGQGRFGRALLVETPSKQLLVLKEISLANLSDEHIEKALQEVVVLRHLRHKHIVSYVESFESGQCLYIVMEFCAGGDLDHRIRQAIKMKQWFQEDRILTWFCQIASALFLCHSNKVVHRDLKTKNIFLTDDDLIKLGDFGISRILDRTLSLANTLVGTPCTMSPEIVNAKPYSFKSDVWALGCVLFELLSLRSPFGSENIAQVFDRIRHSEPPTIPKHYTQSIAALVSDMLQKDPTLRPSLPEIFQRPIIIKAMERSATVLPPPDERTLPLLQRETSYEDITHGSTFTGASSYGMSDPIDSFSKPTTPCARHGCSRQISIHDMTGFCEDCQPIQSEPVGEYPSESDTRHDSLLKSTLRNEIQDIMNQIAPQHSTSVRAALPRQLSADLYGQFRNSPADFSRPHAPGISNRSSIQPKSPPRNLPPEADPSSVLQFDIDSLNLEESLLSPPSSDGAKSSFALIPVIFDEKSDTDLDSDRSFGSKDAATEPVRSSRSRHSRERSLSLGDMRVYAKQIKSNRKRVAILRNIDPGYGKSTENSQFWENSKAARLFQLSIGSMSDEKITDAHKKIKRSRKFRMRVKKRLLRLVNR